MTVQTGWLPSVFAKGEQEDSEACERFGIETKYRVSESGHYSEVRVSGEIPNVLRALAEWWESGVVEDDLAFVQWAVSGLTQKEF